MNGDHARILIIGAGVNGSLCAEGLHNAGFQVTVLARGERYEEIREQGIVIENPFNQKRRITPVPVINRLAADDCYDYNLVIVRKNQVPDLLPMLAQNQSENIVFLVNNPSGPQLFTDALGKERVLLGFVFGAGKREGSLIRAIGGAGPALLSTPFGEIDGRITPRLTRLVGIMRQAGFRVEISTQISDYLATHAALVAPFAHLLIRHQCDNYALARSSADLYLLARAMREALSVLRANGFAIVPKSNAAFFGATPTFLQVILFRLFLATRTAEVGGAWHCQQAPDEMRQLGIELIALVEQSGLPAPAIRKLFATGL
ncbi:MAG TPA: 2-dehydropantoate 2-reductase N-terminal domain-containing protein [Anaerolineaceae bacterium]|nr:2-dehydropantoate 2-reductase N-terminal domain-containing protein [Anaerolineaceae bacterium]